MFKRLKSSLTELLSFALAVGLFPGLAQSQPAQILSNETSAGSARAASAPDPCQGMMYCYDAGPFVAQVAQVVPQKAGKHHVIKLNINFLNTSDRPIVLGYKGGTSSMTDSLGNPYVSTRPGLRDTTAAGIGVVDTRNANASFVLNPGQSGNASFQVTRYNAGRQQIGTSFTYDVVIAELEALNGGQVRIGREHNVHFSALSPGTNNTSISASTSMAANSTGSDPCEGRERCYNAGPFIATVSQLIPQKAGKHHVIKLNINFLNTSDRPIILGYKGGTSAMTDNLGNPYVSTRPGLRDTTAAGIGVVDARDANTSFVLNPDQSRGASFQVTRYNAGRDQIGTSFTYDVVIAELEMLNGGQVHVGREYDVHFADLTPGSGDPSVEGISRAADQAKDLFGK